MLKVTDLSFAYKNSNKIINELSISVNSGECVALLGPNGGGKSTLIKLLAGVLKPLSGQVILNGQDISVLERKRIAQIVAIVYQSPKIYFPYTVEQTVEMGFYSSGKLFTAPEINNKVTEVLTELDILHLKEKKITEISGGELQLVFLARSIVMDTPILFLDEATANLDINHTIKVLGFLKREVRSKGKTIIAILHDLNLVPKFADKAMFLSKDSFTTPQNINDAITEENISKFYNLNKGLFDIQHDLSVLFKI